MKSSLDSFDYLLNDDILEQNWKKLSGGYRNLLVEQQLQTDFVDSLESNQQLSVFFENSFTQFSEEINLTAIERLTGMIESKANHQQSNMMPERRLQKVDERHFELSDTKPKKPKLTVKRKPAGQIAASEKADSNANEKKETVKPISKLSQIKTPKQGKDQQGAITPAFARAELNNRAVKLGRGNEWSDKKIENGHFVKTKMTTDADAEAANAGEGSANQDNKANLPLGTDKKELSFDSKKNVKVKKEQVFISSSNKTIDRLMDEKIEDFQSANKNDSERFDTQRNQTKAASRNNQPANKASLAMHDFSSSASNVARPVRSGNGVGGLRGLAALAKANSEGDKPSQPAASETSQNVTDAMVTQKPLLNVVDSTISSSQPATVASIAKLLADEARRAGIDLEKFRP